MRISSLKISMIIAAIVGIIFPYKFFVSSPLWSPIPQKTSALDIIKPLLYKRVNTFSLKKDFDLVPVAHAGSTYDSAHSYIVVDMDTGKVLSSKNESAQLPIASITKTMSSIVVLDLMSQDDLCVVSDHAAHVIPTKIGVIAGQKLNIRELLHAAMMTSANDAVEVMKECVNHKFGDTIFIEAMNKKAAFLNLKHTHFSNPQGFDSSQNYSSTEDLAVLSYYALKNYPLLAEIVKKDYVRLPANEYHKQFDLYNWQGLLGVYPNVFGLKIGNTDAAGTTTSIAAERDGKRILVVLLGAPDVLQRDLWASQLLDLGFSKSAGLQAMSITEEQLRQKYATWQYWN